MSDLRTAAQQALEALEAMQSYAAAERKGLLICDESITAIKAALEQPEQEPVAWQWLNTAHFRKKLPADAEPGAWNPLYTHPPRRDWRGLTEEEISDIFEAEPRYHYPPICATDREFARAIEQALRSKNDQA